MLPLLACAAFLGCHDLLSSDRPPSRAAAQSAAGRTVAVLDCTASVQSGTITCAPARPARRDSGASRALLGQGQMKMASTNVAFDAATRIFRADVTTQNLLAEAIGTPDGSTVTGVKVFFSSGPTPTSFSSGDTGTVRVENPDGYGNFTAAHQPYFLYSQILAPNQVSAVKQWRWYLGPTVNTFSFQVKVFAAMASEVPFPDLPPDSIPSSIYADSNIVVNPPGGVGRYVKNVVMLWFTREATREERTAAVESVGGRLIGGDGGALYLIKVAPDTSVAPSIGAARRLAQLPQIKSAIPVFFLDLNYLRPEDGNGWERNNWRVNPDSVSTTERWGLERIGAPLAWGCATGDSTLHVAVVDHGFYDVRDIRRNTSSARSGSTDGVDHGTTVASIMAAFGNDTSQMTGVLWRAQIDLYENASVGSGVGPHQVSAVDVLLDLRTALQSGVAAVNLSMGASWSTWGHFPPSTARSADVDHARDMHDLVRAALDSVRAQNGPEPLLVIAAGNDNIDAYWNGTTQVARDSADSSRVIVVAASTRSDGRQSASNDNRAGVWNMVSIAAPGEGVGGLDSSGIAAGHTGTSFAAPLVTGAAGLLKSFDPRLTSREIRSLLIDGAKAGKHWMGGIPVLNVYESLKLAAQRPRAPLCGNRIWAAANKVFVQRDTSGSSAPEELFATNARVDGLQILHDGRHIHFFDEGTSSERLLEWTLSGAWRDVPDTAKVYQERIWESGPSANASWSYSHDGDSLAYFRGLTGSTVSLWIRRWDLGTGRVIGDDSIASVYVGPPSSSPAGYSCIHGLALQCLDSVPTGGGSYRIVGAPVFSPMGDRVLFSVQVTSTNSSVGASYQCPHSDPTVTCANSGSSSATAGSQI
jgi:hypothetical protein